MDFFCEFIFFAIALLLGASFGSFARCAAVRTERGESWHGRLRSRCISCGEAIAARDLVPLVSFIALRGRCRYCGVRIPTLDFAAELICGVLCALFYRCFGLSCAFALSAAALPFLAFHASTDYESGYIYDSWVFAMAGTGRILRLAGGASAVADGAAGAAVGFCFIALIVFASRGRMGMGDATLMLGIGAFAGLKLTVAALYAGFLLGCAAVLPMLAAGKVTRKSAVPLGPFLCAGCVVAFLFGARVLPFFGFSAPWPWNLRAGF